MKDILSTSNNSGVYNVDPTVINTPVSTYGKAVVSKTIDNNWIFVEFLPTSLNEIYYNFYNTYGESPVWSGWKKISLQ